MNILGAFPYPGIVLVYPLTGYDVGIGVSPPHSILALSAYLAHRGIKNRITIIDQRIHKDWKNILQEELKSGPLFVGISSMTGVQLKHALDISAFIRKHSPETPIVFGGVHISLLPEQSIRCDLIDIGIIGEGEETIFELVNALNENKPDKISAIHGLIYKDGNKIVTNPRRPMLDMDSLPIDRFDAINGERYIFKKFSLFSDRELDIGETSRGCCWQCAYCYNTVFHGRRWRSMSKEKTIELIRYNVEKYRLKSLWIRDDNFFVNVSRAAAIIEYIAGKNLCLYLPGITVQEFKRLPKEVYRDLKKVRGMLRFGVESGSDRILEFIKKGIVPEDVYEVNHKCREYDIVPSYNFMIGFPREKMEDVFATVNMMKRLKSENPKAQLNNINMYTPYPGTALFDVYREDFPDGVPQNIYEWVSFHHLNLKKGDVSRRDRRFYENIVEISYLISDLLYQTLSGFIKILFMPIRFWFKLRWQLNAFRLAPEIFLLRKLKRIFLSIE